MYFYKTFYSLHKEIHQVFAFKYKKYIMESRMWIAKNARKHSISKAFYKELWYVFHVQCAIIISTLETIPLPYFHTRTNVFPFEISCTCV